MFSFVSYDVTPVTVLELPLSDFLPLLVFTGNCITAAPVHHCHLVLVFKCLLYVSLH